jgi:hypothetical protein
MKLINCACAAVLGFSTLPAVAGFGSVPSMSTPPMECPGPPPLPPVHKDFPPAELLDDNDAIAKWFKNNVPQMVQQPGLSARDRQLIKYSAVEYIAARRAGTHTYTHTVRHTHTHTHTHNYTHTQSHTHTHTHIHTHTRTRRHGYLFGVRHRAGRPRALLRAHEPLHQVFLRPASPQGSCQSPRAR